MSDTMLLLVTAVTIFFLVKIANGFDPLTLMGWLP
jgi:hypothetical protein